MHWYLHPKLQCGTSSDSESNYLNSRQALTHFDQLRQGLSPLFCFCKPTFSKKKKGSTLATHSRFFKSLTAFTTYKCSDLASDSSDPWLLTQKSDTNPFSEYSAVNCVPLHAVSPTAESSREWDSRSAVSCRAATEWWEAGEEGDTLPLIIFSSRSGFPWPASQLSITASPGTECRAH